MILHNIQTKLEQQVSLIFNSLNEIINSEYELDHHGESMINKNIYFKYIYVAKDLDNNSGNTFYFSIPQRRFMIVSSIHAHLGEAHLRLYEEITSNNEKSLSLIKELDIVVYNNGLIRYALVVPIDKVRYELEHTNEPSSNPTHIPLTTHRFGKIYFDEFFKQLNIRTRDNGPYLIPN